MESRFNHTTIWAVIATVGFFGMCLIVGYAGEKIKDLETQLHTSQTIKWTQDSYIRGLQLRLEEAHKLNGALELENTTDCQ